MRKIILLLVLIFSLNLIWEVSHSLLYDWEAPPLENNVQYYVPRILISTVGDLIIISILFGIISLAHKKINWINKPSRTDISAVIILSIISAVLIEIRGIFIENKWSYNELMPTIFGIGLTPLIQLAVTALLSLWLLSDNSK